MFTGSYMHLCCHHINLHTSLQRKQVKTCLNQKQLSRVVPRKKCSGNMQHIYRKTPMPKCDFNKVASNFIEITFPHGYSPVNLMHIFKTPFPRNTSGGLLLSIKFLPGNFEH